MAPRRLALWIFAAESFHTYRWRTKSLFILAESIATFCTRPKGEACHIHFIVPTVPKGLTHHQLHVFLHLLSVFFFACHQPWTQAKPREVQWAKRIFMLDFLCPRTNGTSRFASSGSTQAFARLPGRSWRQNWRCHMLDMVRGIKILMDE